MTAKKLCEHCGHPDADHCPGRRLHTHWRHMREARVADKACPTRHCTYPLCSCVGRK